MQGALLGSRACKLETLVRGWRMAEIVRIVQTYWADDVGAHKTHLGMMCTQDLSIIQKLPEYKQT